MQNMFVRKHDKEALLSVMLKKEKDNQELQLK